MILSSEGSYSWRPLTTIRKAHKISSWEESGAGKKGTPDDATKTPDSPTPPTDEAEATTTADPDPAPLENTKAVRLQEAIDTLLDLTTAPDQGTAEIEAKMADLANVAQAVLGVLAK